MASRIELKHWIEAKEEVFFYFQELTELQLGTPM